MSISTGCITAFTVPPSCAARAGRPIRGAITPNIAVVLRGEREADAALAGELAAMELL